MPTDVQARSAEVGLQDGSLDPDILPGTQALYQERKWRELGTGAEVADVAVSRWRDSQISSWHEATTPPDRYFIAIALKLARAKLIRGQRIIFDGTMPAGTLYVAGPSKQLSAQFQACDFLHLHVSATHFPAPLMQRPVATEGLNDLVLPRDPFAEQLARALTNPGSVGDRRFVQCAGEILAIYLTQFVSQRTKVNALPSWRLRRVEEYVDAHLRRKIGLSDLANAAGLSRMYFASLFRAATGYSPRKLLTE